MPSLLSSRGKLKSDIHSSGEVDMFVFVSHCDRDIEIDGMFKWWY